MVFVSMNRDELTAYLGAKTATAVAAWADMTDRVAHVPAREWRPSGHTGAQLAKLFITDPVHGTQAVILKVLPPGQDAEAAAHRRAVREAPQAFRTHFVGQVFDSVRMPDGGTLTFQEPAGHCVDWRPMAELPVASIPAACGRVARSLISEWNPDLVVLPKNVVEMLRDDIVDNDSAIGQLGRVQSASSPWIRVEGGLVPNPLHLLGEYSPLAGTRVDLAVGRAHSDLHGKNVLMWQRLGDVELDNFILVDLMTYTSAGQLGRDIVRMLLSATAPLLRNLSEPERRLLLPVFVRPDLAVGRRVQPVIVETVRTVNSAARTSLRKCGDEIWRAQYQLSLVTQGLAMASFENLGTELRWWFFRLAGHAAHELFVEMGLSTEAPNDTATLTNPFRAGATVVDLPSKRSTGSARSKPIAVQGF
jgi:hypothetical protein